MTQRCACGCGQPVTRERAIYARPSCKARAQAGRRRVSRLTAVESPAVPLPRMKPTTRRVLKALIAVGGRGATTRELMQPDVGGARFGGRLYELRGLGFRIDAKQERPGSWRYWLRSSPGSERMFDVTPGEKRAA